MSGSVFTPKIQPQAAPAESEPIVPPKDDAAGNILIKVAQYAVVALIGLVPVFFTPGLWASLGFDKVLLAVGASVAVIIALSLVTLRRSHAVTVLPLSLGIFWILTFVALISGVLSGDAQDAIRGSVFETQTVGFLAVMALLMTIPLVLQGSKKMTAKALMFFGGVAGLLLVYNVVRIFFGADFLPLGAFGAVTISPIGSFNDLAIFSGLMILLGLITLFQLPLRAGLSYGVAGIVALSLIILSVVNFFNIWVIIGFFGLLMFVYLLSRDTLFQTETAEAPATNSPTSKVLILTTAVVCIVSALFIVAGDFAGNRISQITGVNYVEVRPSVEATIGVTGAVYSEDLLLGVGPNRFVDAWREHKDRSINETIFWETDFVAGSGYIPTLFVNLGALGALLLVAFHVLFLYLGYRMLLRNTQNDSYWNYFGVFSFSGAAFLWAMSYIYVPGAGILLLTALFTGFTFVAMAKSVPNAQKRVPLAVNRQRGFFLMAATIFVITASVGVLFSVGEQYVAQAQFSESSVTAQSVPEFEQVALSSYGLYPDDRFLSARAQIQLATLNALVNIPEPTPENQQQFFAAAEQALVFAEQAVAEDATNPDNFAVLAGIYSNLAAAGIDGAQQRAEESLAQAQALDPLNPGYRLLSAQLAARIGDVEKARSEIIEALNLKRNYTQALFLAAQLDIAEGNTESAITTTRAIITLEPNNPTRYFQLGLLLSANNQADEAIAAFQLAIQLDPDYANARYLLALTYVSVGEVDAALSELRIVQETNQENQQLGVLIEQLESGVEVVAPDLGFEAPVSEAGPESDFDATVLTEEQIDTDLITPVNTVSGDVDEVQEAEASPVVESTETVEESEATEEQGGE